MTFNFSSICSFVRRHPGLLLVLIGVAGESILDWQDSHGTLGWVRRFFSLVLIARLIEEFYEASKSDKEVAALTLQTASAQKQIAEISLEVAKANQAAAEANERAARLEKEAEEGRLEVEKIRLAQQPRNFTVEQRKGFITSLDKAVKRPVRVIALTNTPESTAWARHIRSALDEAGMSDPAHKDIECIIGVGLNTQDSHTTAIAYYNDEEALKDFNASERL